MRTVGAALFALVVSSPVYVSTPSQAAAETRSLKLYFIHTGEKAVITYKRNGKFDPKGLEQLNRFLRDWRKNQPTRMDPRLFDLIWEVYRQSGSNGYINVVCGFRSPSTNAMLKSRSRNSGVAEKSQHMLGKAMDFFIPDIKLAKLREIGMKLQVGGVGYYPRSGSPFVHMDVGGVRAWPRMSRDELVRLFPNGNTMHIPADGRPLPGYDQAVADYKRRASSSEIEVASSGSYSSSASHKPKTLFAALFGGGADEEEDSSEDSAPAAPAAPVAIAKAVPKAAEPAEAEAPAATEVATLAAPIPQVRPAFAEPQPAGSDMATAMIPANSGNAAQQALAAVTAPTRGADGQPAYPDLSAYSVPVPSLLGQRRAPGDAEQPEEQVALAHIPTPAERPALAEKLLAAADADADAAEDVADAPESALSPAMAQALDQQNKAPADRAMGSVEDAIKAAAPPAPAPQAPPVQLAALAPATAPARQTFGDGFDIPSPAERPQMEKAAAAAPTQPVKGGRPTQREASEADAGRTSLRTEPKLTQTIISRWALTKSRMDTVTKPVKAPRFVSQTMRAQPTAVYAEGFTKTASIDPGRFSGNAVNFLEVRKFNTN